MTSPITSVTHRQLLLALEARTDVARSLHEAQQRNLSYYYTGALCATADPARPHIFAQSLSKNYRKCVVCFEEWREANNVTDRSPMTRSDARALGLRFYMPLLRCYRGHHALRRTSNNACTGCKRSDKVRGMDAP